ncbi:MAG: hypothetical protein OEV87_10120 [Phycisphaerae bacterium]|nr:hypothetical protein [Phycisphaerae bacterium]
MVLGAGADGLDEADALGDRAAFGAGADLVALEGVDDRVGLLALGADFAWERPADFELDSPLLPRPSAGTISSELKNTIPAMRTNCF